MLRERLCDGVAVLIDRSVARPPGPVRRGPGSREHLTPEQARGGPASAATDVRGIGATLFEAKTSPRAEDPPQRDALRFRALPLRCTHVVRTASPVLPATGPRSALGPG
ncbi:hypothetical protein [Nocardioides sp. InS609-2]|uniref:hypothetical protein n=1 Tax=Nocardioides sp. InS609-2 TaxID=2760705 RepID=UPI0020BDB819|nr:hypothetical protein [Nocardioides sp. InS609-2]